MKTIFFCFGIWMILLLCSTAVLSENTKVVYGGVLEFITLLIAMLITAAIYYYVQKKKDEEELSIAEESTIIENNGSSNESREVHQLIQKTLTKAKELEKVIMNDDYSYDAFAFSSGNVRISKEMFSEIKEGMTSMLRVLKDVCWQDDFIALLRKASHTNGESDAYYFNLKSMLIKDIIRCFNEMGYAAQANDATPQGQALYIVLRFVSDDTEQYSYSYEDFFFAMESDASKKECFRIVNKQIKIYSEVKNDATSMVGLDDFKTMLTLAIYKDEITEYFRMLIFRLFQLFAKMDGSITENEESWLRRILKMQELLEEQYTDDEGNPLPKQPKKEWIAKAEERLDAVKQLKRHPVKKEAQTISSSIKELSELVGLSETKKEITTLANYIQMKLKRDEMGMKSPNVSYHCVFAGNPGTGKTTVARILAGIYKDLGLLKKGHLVETDRSGLIAEYVGQTAVKTNKIIDKALDGVLFIDEAYSLVQGGKEDYGKEAIATLLKRMEDNRDRLVVIVAGYTKEMEDFIDSNPGLQSRFNRYIHFADYTAEELYDIFCLQLKKNEYTINEDASKQLKNILAGAVAHKPRDFGNARYVRNLFEKVIENQANRLAKEQNPTKEMMAELREEDFKV